MSLYSQNIHSFLAGRFKVLYVILKSGFVVKYKTKEFRFFDYFYRRFSPKDVRV